MPQSDLRLEILGTAFTITADEETPYLEKLLNDYYTKDRGRAKIHRA